MSIKLFIKKNQILYNNIRIFKQTHCVYLFIFHPLHYTAQIKQNYSDTTGASEKRIALNLHKTYYVHSSGIQVKIQLCIGVVCINIIIYVLTPNVNITITIII